MPDGPDLAALREKAENADGHVVLLTADSLLAVLSLVDDLRAENERLREAVKFAAVDLAIVHHMFDGGPVVRGILDRLGEALAGSPAANEEQQ